MLMNILVFAHRYSLLSILTVGLCFALSGEGSNGSSALSDLIAKARREKASIPLIGVHDALSAKIFESACPSNDMALYVSGFGVSAARLGVPDAGILDRTEMVASASHIGHTTRSPLIVDCDTGYGGSPTIRRTLVELSGTPSVAAVSIEDQNFPKRCGYVAGNSVSVVSREDSKKRIRAALAAREEAYEKTGNKVLVVARTDCRLELGFQEAVERCLLYQELQADIVYAESISSADEYRKLRDQVEKPMILAQVQVGDPDHDKSLLALDDIGELGYELSLWGIVGLQAAASAMEDAANEVFRCKGSVHNTPIATLAKLKAIVGFPELDQFEDKYGCL